LIDHTEAPDTFKARKKLKQLFESKSYTVEEEVQLDTVTNNMNEEIWPLYQADMLLTQQFIIELDPQSAEKGKSKGHGTHKRIVHDQWRDKNVRNQINLKTVRLIPSDINSQSPEQIIEEIEYQLQHQQEE
jgi:hypothetical protein